MDTAPENPSLEAGFLDKVLAYKKNLIKSKRTYFAPLKKKLAGQHFTRYQLFKKAIHRPGKLCLIAEIKKASPSAGLIRSQFDLISIAKAYINNGASALSILTEDKYFLGKPAYIKQVTEHFTVPVLTKDFILDEDQIFEAFYNGASAVLLIAAILEDRQLQHLLQVAQRLDLDAVVEVHTPEELERVLKLKPDIIGINNRNLKNLQVDLGVGEKLIVQIPKNRTIVIESGIKTHEDVLRFEKLGAHAVLIGEVFLQASDVGRKVREIMQGPRPHRQRHHSREAKAHGQGQDLRNYE